jgi:hypothetical protein
MTGGAYRLRDGDDVVYLLPFKDGGGRVVYRQDAKTFETQRETVSPLRARRLAESGRKVELYETPAWADPATSPPTAP